MQVPARRAMEELLEHFRFALNPFQPTVLNEEVRSHIERFMGKERLDRALAKVSSAPGLSTIRINTVALPDFVNNVDREWRVVAKHTSTQEDRPSFLPPQLWSFFLEHQKQGFEWVITSVPDVPELVGVALTPSTDVEVPREAPKREYPLVVVDFSSAMSLLRGADLFAVGVIAIESYVKAGDKVSVVVDLDRVLCKGHIITPGTSSSFDHFPFIGNGIAKFERKEMLRTKTGVGVEMTHQFFPFVSLNSLESSIAQDILMLQNLPSCLAARILQPQPGERIFDMCAAPGGKTTHIATLMNNSGELYAADRSKRRMQSLKNLCERWQLGCVRPLFLDSATCVSDSPDPGPKKFRPESFDRILLDGPCSGIGLRPKFRDEQSLNDLLGLQDYQQKLLSTASRLLKPNGTLVYSTCTINPGENEVNVAWALGNLPLELVPQPEEYVCGSTMGLENCGLDDDQRRMVQRFDPSLIDTNAFFVAKFTKKPS